MDYHHKYAKYKSKYLDLKYQQGGLNLKRHKWRHRIILVQTPSYKDQRYIKAKETFQKHIQRFHKRCTKMLSQLADDFTVKLIGFDGTTKKTYPKLDAKAIIQAIDRMPMGDTRCNLSLYADYNPKTTTPGLGFKDKAKAEYTLKKIKGRSEKYQVSVVNTMLGRAKNHPNQTPDMREAIQVFEKWLKQRK